MESAGRILFIIMVLAVFTGIAVVFLDKDYRPAKIAETNRGIFFNIPVDLPSNAPDESHQP